MLPPYGEVLSIVQHLAPTWRVESHRACARLLRAVWERSCLCLSDLARALPAPEQPLHGRLKRLERFLKNPHLDELALSVRWLVLAYQWVAEAPAPQPAVPLLPVLLDTVYFEPFALPLASVPCGSRGLPITLATYHRRRLLACFPPEATWPDPADPGWPSLRRRRGLPARPAPAAAVPAAFASQNRIEEHLLALLGRLVSPALRAVTVADRGFARASLLAWRRRRGRDFVMRIDADTHVYLAPDQPSQPVAQALAVRPGQRRWAATAWYQQEERVPCALLALRAAEADEPWYLATTLEEADWTEALYRWRMRCEATHRDEKTGLLLRCGGGAHRLTNVLHLHRLLLVLALAEWLCALVGLQAHRDLPAAASGPAPLPPAPAAPDPPASPTPLPPLDATAPDVANDLPYLAQGPAAPPPVCPHRGPVYKPAAWLRRFEALRGARPLELRPPGLGSAPGPRPAPAHPAAGPLAGHLPLDPQALLAALATPLSAPPLVARRRGRLIQRGVLQGRMRLDTVAAMPHDGAPDVVLPGGDHGPARRQGRGPARRRRPPSPGDPGDRSALSRRGALLRRARSRAGEVRAAPPRPRRRRERGPGDGGVRPVPPHLLRGAGRLAGARLARPAAGATGPARRPQAHGRTGRLPRGAARPGAPPARRAAGAPGGGALRPGGDRRSVERALARQAKGGRR